MLVLVWVLDGKQKKYTLFNLSKTRNSLNGVRYLKESIRTLEKRVGGNLGRQRAAMIQPPKLSL